MRPPLNCCNKSFSVSVMTFGVSALLRSLIGTETGQIAGPVIPLNGVFLVFIKGCIRFFIKYLGKSDGDNRVVFPHYFVAQLGMNP